MLSDVCLSDVCRIHPVGGGISWRPPAYSLFSIVMRMELTRSCWPLLVSRWTRYNSSGIAVKFVFIYAFLCFRPGEIPAGSCHPVRTASSTITVIAVEITDSLLGHAVNFGLYLLHHLKRRPHCGQCRPGLAGRNLTQLTNSNWPELGLDRQVCDEFHGGGSLRWEWTWTHRRL